MAAAFILRMLRTVIKQEGTIMPLLLQIILGICAPIIAGYGVYIGFQQWKLSTHKLKLDLFGKRWEVYAATNDAIVSQLNGNDEALRETFQEFNRKRMDAKFLFLKDLNDYLEKINTAILDLHALNRNLTSESMRANSSERSAVTKQILDQTEWLRSQLNILVPTFHKYLDFSKL